MAVILVKLDTITPKLNQLAKEFRTPAGFSRVIGRALLNSTQQFYREKNSNFWGRFVTGYASAEGGKERWENTTETGKPRVSISGEAGAIMIHKVNGGRIIPKTGKHLAIPSDENQRPERWPRNYPDGALVPLFGKNGIYALAEAKGIRKQQRFSKGAVKGQARQARRLATEQGLKGAARKAYIKAWKKTITRWKGNIFQERRNLAVLFWLAKFVDQQPDPNALPPMDRLSTDILDAASNYIQAKISSKP